LERGERYPTTAVIAGADDIAVTITVAITVAVTVAITVATADSAVAGAPRA
jgi:hypothetical protein